MMKFFFNFGMCAVITRIILRNDIKNVYFGND